MSKAGIAAWLRRAWQMFAGGEPRKTVVLPGAPRVVSGRPLPKPTPYLLRRFSETPVARKAINTIKDRIAGMRWRVQPKGGSLAGAEDARIEIIASTFEVPNADDSFRSLSEQVLEDLLIGGCGTIEVQLTANPQRPLMLWPVDGLTVQIYAGWSGNADEPRYAQLTPWGERVDLLNDELIYIRQNPRTSTPFGLGRLEVAFETIQRLLGAQEYAGRLASNTVVQFALWLQELPPATYDKVISWWQNEIEGTGKVPIIANLPAKPEVLRFSEGSDRDLRLEWQRFLIRIIADAFDLPPLLLGLEQDINRSTAEALVDEAFRTAVVPTARLYAEHLTREVIAFLLASLSSSGGNSNAVDCGSGTSLDDHTALTWYAWVYQTSNVGNLNRGVISKNVSSIGNGKALRVTGATGGSNVNRMGVSIQRATTNATFVGSNSSFVTALNTRTFVAVTYDESDGPRGWRGTLSAPVAEINYLTGPTVGSGTTSSDASGNLRIGNFLAGEILSFPGRISVVAIYNRRMSQADLRVHQMRPFCSRDDGCRLFVNLGGGAGTGTQADLSGHGNNCTVSGLSVANHVPIAR